MASNESENNNNNNNNMIQISDDQLSQFMAFSGSSDPSVARQYLEMSGNNLETAVSLFMDHGAGGGGMGGMGGMGGGGGGATGSGMGGPPMGATGTGMGGGGDYDVRAPDATRTMRLLGGDSPNPRGNRGNAGGMGGGMGGMGMGMGGNEPSAALIAAMGGPAAREMMRNMMAAENGMDDGVGVGMGNTWAAAGLNNHHLGPNDFRNPSNRSSSRHDRTGSGGSGDGGNARRSSNRRSNNNDNVNANGNESDDDDDDVQVVDADGQAMDEDDEEEYNYASSDDDDSHDLGGSTNARGGNANNNTATPPSLSTMFAQPTHLMHRAGGFMGAKNFAKDARRWLLVNIQSDNDFACHALNRDVWRDELVENLVREGFILWQAMSHSNEGQTYIQRYKVHGYPHLAIIDPRTGSLLWRKEGWTQVNPLTADQFVEIASDFCSRHSFDKLPTAARHAYTNGIPLGGAGANESSSSKSNNKRPITELTEEEQLQAAIRASMQEDAGDNNDNGDEDVQVLDGDDDDVDVKPSADDNNNDDESKPSAFEQEILTMEVGGEPSGGSVARVQIRMPDGKRLVRKFAGDSPVKIIYAFVAQNNEEAKGGRAFELKAKFPPQDLLSHAEETVMGFGLNGEAINVIWN